MQANTIRLFKSFWSLQNHPVLKFGLVSTSMNGIRTHPLSWMHLISWYALKISASSRPSDCNDVLVGVGGWPLQTPGAAGIAGTRAP